MAIQYVSTQSSKTDTGRKTIIHLQKILILWEHVRHALSANIILAGTLVLCDSMVNVCLSILMLISKK